jgi:hypothetical protein
MPMRQLRPGLRTWKMHLGGVAGGTNHTFDTFLDMPEYHNVATRMFARQAVRK